MESPKPANEAKDHHYVPRFLLRQWLVEGKLKAYWWNRYTDELCFEGDKGVGGYCFERHLLTLNEHALGRDVIETKFFNHIDNQGSIVRAKLVNKGVASLSGEERCDVIRLLLSLDMRRPALVQKLRSESDQWARTLNADEQLSALFLDHDLEGTAVDYLEKNGVILEDRAMLIIQSLVDNKKIGPRLINAFWHLVTLGPSDGSFVLSDRPLIKYSLDKPDGYWVLPLDPKHALVLTPYEAVIKAIRKITPQRFAKEINPQSAMQAERFIFSIDPNASRWVGKYLKYGAAHSVVEDHLQ